MWSEGIDFDPCFAKVLYFKVILWTWGSWNSVSLDEIVNIVGLGSGSV